MLSETGDIIKTFCLNELYFKQPRDDYREFLKLVVIFLGGEVPNQKFSPPGALHHARWMAKAIYSLKIFLFMHQFKMSSQETQGIRDTCLFIVLIYVKAWYKCKYAIVSYNICKYR